MPQARPVKRPATVADFDVRWMEAFEERAAIMQFDAKVPRATAERWAAECLARVKGAV